jgi:hypothetical protein
MSGYISFRYQLSRAFTTLFLTTLLSGAVCLVANSILARGSGGRGSSYKHRYKDFNYRIGSLTEYFKLADVEAVWDDLRQMPPKVLEPVELDVLSEIFISSLCSH